MGDALLGAGVGHFDDDVRTQRGLERRSSPPVEDRLGRAATDEVRIARVAAYARRCDIRRQAIAAGDAPEGQRVGQCGAAAQESDRVGARQRDGDGAAQVLLAGNRVQAAEREGQDCTAARAGLT